MEKVQDLERVQFRFANSPLRMELLGRINPATETATDVTLRDLARYYALLALSVPRFPEKEALLLIDSLSGWTWDVASANLLWAHVEQSMRAEGLDQKWGVGGPDLIARLKDLTLLECVALCDAVDRFWLARDRDPAASNDDLAQRVGLCYTRVAARRL